MARTYLIALFLLAGKGLTKADDGDLPYPEDPLCGYYGKETAHRVYKGDDVAIGEFPWVVYIRVNIAVTSKHEICTGGILSEKWILTAAHCFEK